MLCSPTGRCVFLCVWSVLVSLFSSSFLAVCICNYDRASLCFALYNIAGLLFFFYFQCVFVFVWCIICCQRPLPVYPIAGIKHQSWTMQEGQISNKHSIKFSRTTVRSLVFRV